MKKLMEDPAYGASSHSVEGLERTLNLIKNSGSDYMLDLTHIKQDHEQSQPRRRFGIEGKSFMIAPYDDEEPKTINEALSGPKIEEWIKVMERKWSQWILIKFGT